MVGRVDTGVQKTAARGFDRVHRTLCGGVRKGGGTRTGTWGRKRLAFDQNQEPVPSPKRLSRSQHTWIPAPYRPYRTDFSQSILLRLQRVQRPRATPQAADTIRLVKVRLLLTFLLSPRFGRGMPSIARWLNGAQTSGEYLLPWSWLRGGVRKLEFSLSRLLPLPSPMSCQEPTG